MALAGGVFTRGEPKPTREMAPGRDALDLADGGNSRQNGANRRRVRRSVPAICHGLRHRSRKVRVGAGGLDCERSFIEPDAGVVSHVSLVITFSCAVTRRIYPGVSRTDVDQTGAHGSHWIATHVSGIAESRTHGVELAAHGAPHEFIQCGSWSRYSAADDP
jgi:hypothetical protein